MLVKPYKPDKVWNADEYLEWESAQPYKNELIDNRVWVMCGAGRRHGLISINLMTTLHPLLDEQVYTLLGSRMCLRVDPDSTFVYPDLTIVRGEPRMSRRLNQHVFEDPTLIFEILSPSTENMDRTRKRDLYQQLESLQAYILVSQEEPRIESYSRQEDGWFYRDWSGLDAVLELKAVGCEIPLSDIYRHIGLADA